MNGFILVPEQVEHFGSDEEGHKDPHESDVNAQCELQHSSPPSAVRKSGKVQGFDHRYSFQVFFTWPLVI